MESALQHLSTLIGSKEYAKQQQPADGALYDGAEAEMTAWPHG